VLLDRPSKVLAGSTAWVITAAEIWIEASVIEDQSGIACGRRETGGEYQGAAIRASSARLSPSGIEAVLSTSLVLLQDATERRR
jgi:hypothetical protein